MIQICYKCLSIIIIGLIYLLSVDCGGYIYGETEGHFQNSMRLSVSICTPDPNGIGLKANDTNKNELLIKTGKLVNGYRQIIGHFNGRAFNKNMWVKQYTDADNMIELNLILLIENNSLFSFDFEKPKLVLSNIFQLNLTTLDESNNSTTTSSSKTYFSIGNIDNSSVSSRSTKQSIGCLRHLFFLKKRVKFEKAGHNFFPECFIYISERFCRDGLCSPKKYWMDVLSCFLSSINTHEYCFSNLLYGQRHSYVLMESNRNPKVVKLAWRQQYSGNYCLLQIKTKNKWISFQTNKLNELVKCIVKNKSKNCTTKLWPNISTNVIHVLVITMQFSKNTVQISNGRDVFTYSDQSMTFPEQINVGFSFKSTVCDTFEGESAFLFNPTQFKLESGKLNSSEGVIILTVSVVSLLVLVSIAFISYKIYRLFKSDGKLMPQYEEPLQLNDVGPSNPNCEYT